MTSTLLKISVQSDPPHLINADFNRLPPVMPQPKYEFDHELSNELKTKRIRIAPESPKGWLEREFNVL